MEDSADEDATLKKILGYHHAIDAHVAGGRWAPVMMYAPGILLMALAADIDAAIAAIVVLGLIIFIQWIMNTPTLYRFTRPAHFPLRMFLVYYIINCLASREEPGFLNIIGYTLGLLFIIGECVAGDGATLKAYRLHCQYEVIKPLPNRLFLCRRHGAAHSVDIMGTCLPVSEKITGIGSWPSDFALIADVQGLIVELRPMGIFDWKDVFLEKQNNPRSHHRYMGLDIFSPGAATIDALNLAIEEQLAISAKEQAKKEMMLEDA